jgi:hypothetical protein
MDLPRRPYRPTGDGLRFILREGGTYAIQGETVDGWSAGGVFDDHDLLLCAVNEMDCAPDGLFLEIGVDPVERDVTNYLELGPESIETKHVPWRYRLPVVVIAEDGPDLNREEALACAAQLKAALAGIGWPMPVFGDLGETAVLLYAIDLPNDGRTESLLDGVLAALDDVFPEWIVVDRSFAKAPNWLPVFGTMQYGHLCTMIAAPFELEQVPAGMLARLATGEDEITLEDHVWPDSLTRMPPQRNAWDRDGCASFEPWRDGGDTM